MTLKRSSVGFLIAGNDARVDFKLNQWMTKDEVLAAIDRIEYGGGNTNTTGGLRETRLSIFTEAAGDRPKFPNVLLLITDGLPSREVDGLQDEVNRIKALGVTIIAVGVTQAVNLSVTQSSDLLIHSRAFYFNEMQKCFG